jgi:hypothetical protein
MMSPPPPPPPGTWYTQVAPPPKPETASILCIVGGIFAMLLDVAYLLGGLACTSHGPPPANPSGLVSECQTIATLGAIGVAGGVATLTCGALMQSAPASHRILGAIAVAGALFGLPALFLAGGGQVPFIAAPVVGIVGGALAFTWRPNLVQPHGGPAPYLSR